MVSDVLNRVKEVFERYSWRADVEDALEALGFKLWRGMEGKDEQIWFSEDGKTILYLNWVDAVCYFYEETERVEMV